MTLRRDLHEQNRLSWNVATRAHNSHKGDQAAFFRARQSTLFPEELALLGDLSGLRLAHLQCNAGQDTLSLALRGAEVHGVDISDEAISFAQELARAAEIPATFSRADLIDWFATTPEASFDVVFTSYGALSWLSDLAPWAEGIARVLRPQGRLVIVEFHPVLFMMGDDLRPAYPYQGGALTTQDGVSDYVADSRGGLVVTDYQAGETAFSNPHPDHSFSWGLAEIVQATLRAGLRLERLEEYCYSNGWCAAPGMRLSEGRRYLPPAGVPDFPMMFGLVARR